MRYEYLIIFMGSKGMGRTSLVLDKPITDVSTLNEIDNNLRKQKDVEGNVDETIFCINYKLLKSFQV